MVSRDDTKIERNNYETKRLELEASSTTTSNERTLNGPPVGQWKNQKQFLFMFNLKKPTWWRYQPFLLHGHLFPIHFFQEDVNLMSRYASWKPKIYWKKTTFCFGGLLRDLQNPTANEFQLLGLENDSFLWGKACFQGGWTRVWTGLPPKTNMTMEKQPWMKMQSPIKIVIVHVPLFLFQDSKIHRTFSCFLLLPKKRGLDCQRF